MKLQEIVPFKTSIFTAQFEDTSWLIPKILELSLHQKTTTVSNMGGWQSIKYNTLEELPYMKPIISTIAESLIPLYKRMGIKSQEIRLGNFWFNINRKYSYNLTHNHPGSYFSAVLYSKVPKNSGNITFVRPDDLPNYVFDVEYTEDNWTEYFIEPKDNLLIIFPAWLNHFVGQNLTEDEDDCRISIAFNFC
jgi:uncharacterized protein (TIGR02466 family)